MEWQAAPDGLTLEPNGVHVWQARLDVPPDQVAAFAQMLSADEQLRAKRFKFEVHRDRFIVGRGILRSLLSRYLGCSPQALTFDYGVHGKPMLLNVPRSQLSCQPLQLDSQAIQLNAQSSQLNCQPIQFNVAHSQDFALYVFSRDRMVGVDVEQIRTIDSLDSLTRRFFLPSEHASICNADPNDQARLFFRYWTCKESFLKATGDGLGKLGELEIALSTDQAPQLKRLPAGQRIEDWYLQELNLGEFVGAISAKRTSEKTGVALPQSLKVQQFSFSQT